MLFCGNSNISKTECVFFSFCKTAYFGMSLTQKPAGKGHTSPEHFQKKEVYHSSTTFTC